MWTFSHIFIRNVLKEQFPGEPLYWQKHTQILIAGV